jgi:multiple antibiotic resistance protein
LACLCIGLALSVAICAILLFKFIHDHALKHNEVYLQRYIAIAGRVTALFTGSFAIELIFKGIEGWWPAMNVMQQ